MVVRRHRITSFVCIVFTFTNGATVLSQSPSPAKKKTTAQPAQTLANAPTVDVRFKKQHELIMTLVQKHGYGLAEGEPFKYIKDPQNEERSALRRLMMSSPGHGEFDPTGKLLPRQGEDSFESFMLVLHMLPDGRVPSSTVSSGAITFGDVLDDVLQLKPYEFDCPPNLRLTYMPGDWVLLREPDQTKRLSDTGAAALERIFNEQCNLGVKVAWKMFERPAITIRGEYAPQPSGGQYDDEKVAAQSDGMFLIDVRRAVSYHPEVMIGRFDEFLEAIGYLLMMPVVNEAESVPTNRLVTWNEAGKAVEGNSRLKPEHEQRVLQSLSEQLGYDFRIEPRDVKLLSIEPAD